MPEREMLAFVSYLRRIPLLAVAERILLWVGIHPGVRVPVTAKLSRKFYERLGDDIANELVDWFNMVDDTYRSELCEVNERELHPL